MSTLTDLVAKLVSLGDERIEKFDDKLQEQVSWLDETVAQTRASMRQYALPVCVCFEKARTARMNSWICVYVFPCVFAFVFVFVYACVL